MSGNWQGNFKHVTPGEPVAADVVARPDRALENRTNYLRDRLDAAELGQALYDTSVPVAPDVLPGHAVYWNYTTQRYERALAAVATDSVTQLLTVQPSSDCLGLCFRKRSATVADIVMRGVISLPELSNAIGGTIAPGRYYLSAVNPGKLVQAQPATSVYVCFVLGPKDSCSDVPRVVVMPHVKDMLDDHTHYRFDLVCQPAGFSDLTDGQYTVESPDVELQGWLPATHTIFAGNAPAGAKFGYNLSAHTAVSRVWPPVPVQSVAVLWDKGADNVGATEVPQGPTGKVICDTYGIWWMTDCEGEIPWPADYDPLATAPDFTTCPRAELMRIAIIYMRMLTGNDRNVVTKLMPAAGSPISVTNCSGMPAVTGDLHIDLDLAIHPTSVLGGQAIKGVLNGQKLQAGWVTEGLVAHNQTQVSLRGTHTRLLTTDEKDALSLPLTAAVTAHQGLISLEVDNQFADRELSPQIIRLNDTVERLYMDIPYLGFPAGQASLMRVRFNVPDSNLGVNLQMAIRLTFFGRGTSSQSIPALYMSYRRIARPGTGTTALPTSDTALTFNSVASPATDTAIERNSAQFAVAEGDVVLVTIGRTSGDAYPEVGVLRVSGIISKSA
jgi:hypothetical protein